jgi:hypothetical protein
MFPILLSTTNSLFFWPVLPATTCHLIDWPRSQRKRRRDARRTGHYPKK